MKIHFKTKLLLKAKMWRNNVHGYIYLQTSKYVYKHRKNFTNLNILLKAVKYEKIMFIKILLIE